MDFKEFANEAVKAGLSPCDKGNLHWQVKGKLLVNYYPSRGTIYVAGTTKGRRSYNLEEVFRYCNELPKPNEFAKIAKRKQYTKANQKLWHRSPYCWICKKKLTVEAGTIDHFIPLSKGGLNNENNYRLACEPCNLKRGNSL